MSTIPLIFKVTGDDAAKSAFGNVGAAGKSMGADVERGASGASTANDRFVAKTSAVEKAAGRSTRGVRGLGKSFGEFGARLKGAATSDSTLFGVASGVGLRMLSNNLIAAGDEAEAANLKLEAMAGALNLPAGSVGTIRATADEMAALTGMDDDQLTNVSARMLSFGLNAQQVKGILPGLIGQARTMDQDLGSVADAFGRAYASGNASALKRSGVVLSEVDLNNIKALKKQGDYAGAQAATYRAVQNSLAKYAIKAGEGRSTAQVARGRYATQMGNAQEAMGQGAGRFRGAYQGALAPMLGNLAANHPGVLGAAGGAIEAGSIVAPVFTVMATIGQAMPAFKGLGNAIGASARLVRGLGTASTWMGNTQLIAAGKTRIASFWTAAFGNSSLIASGRLRLASLTAGSALGGVGVALGALAAIAWSIQDIAQSSKDSTLSDAAYEKKRGTRGQLENSAAKGLNGLNLKEQVRGLSLDKQLAEVNRRAAARRAARRNAAGSVDVRPGMARVTRPDGSRERNINIRLREGRSDFRQALATF